MPGGPRCQGSARWEALVAGRPSLPGGGKGLYEGKHLAHLAKGPPLPRSAKNVLQILYLMTKFNVAKSGLDF